MSTIVLSKPTRRRRVIRNAPVGAKKPFKLTLTAEDIELDNAISAAAARNLAARRP